MKKISLVFLFLLLLIYPRKTFATTVSNRSDGTFLLDGQPYFPIGFSPQSLVYSVSETDWQDLKNSGINFTNDGNNPYRFTELNNKLKAQGLNVVIISYGPGNSNHAVMTPTEEAMAQINLAKNENNFLGYYGYDEPTITEGCYSDNRSLTPERKEYYQTIFQNDPNHFIWTNHFQHDPIWDPEWADCKNPLLTSPLLVNYNISSRSYVTGTDVYDNWVKVGYLSGVHKEVAKVVATELQKLRPGINGGVIMIIPGYSQASYENRLNSAVDAVINGANGVVFYFDNADSKIYEWTDYWRLPWLTTPGIWEKWKTLSAYSEVKQVASILKEAYPGLTGTINSTITAGNIRLLAKNGTDGKLYIFAANENASNDVQTGFNGLPAGDYYEITQKQTFSAAQLSSFTFPKYSVRIYVQVSPPTPTSVTPNCATNFSVNCAGSTANISWKPPINTPVSSYNVRLNKEPYPSPDYWYKPEQGDQWLTTKTTSVSLSVDMGANYQYDVQPVTSGGVLGERCPFNIFNCPAPTLTPTPIAGDYDGNRIVDLADFGRWKDRYLAVPPTMTLTDFGLWKTSYSATLK